ncbi:MAG: MBL fold metallo-hydrolase [Desulfobacterota bacterium]|nr:MBL fold metallo-hydrolase [Thermodesulfobacteriota bacterium]
MKITDGIYAYPWTDMMVNNCNTYVLQKEGLILIDPGLKRYVPQIMAGMKKDGLNPDDISLVINTHSHPDHLDGDAYFLQTRAKIALHEEEEKFLKHVGVDFFQMFGLEPPQYRVDVYASEGTLTAAGITLQIIHTPGHSPGSICIYWPEKKVMATGDVVFSGSIGRTDFPGGSSSTLKKSIEKISTYACDYLLPGHNEVIEGAVEIKRNFDFIKRSFFSFL